VVEVANWMAAPGAAALMADMGADVIKVGPLRGDAHARGEGTTWTPPRQTPGS
jgi:crotonobetainyl-CoA:carnitine CoA-transferase CaiB-like acyl-CoA transferase